MPSLKKFSPLKKVSELLLETQKKRFTANRCSLYIRYTTSDPHTKISRNVTEMDKIQRQSVD